MKTHMGLIIKKHKEEFRRRCDKDEEKAEEEQSIGNENKSVDSESEGEDNISYFSNDYIDEMEEIRKMHKELRRRIKIMKEMSGVD